MKVFLLEKAGEKAGLKMDKREFLGRYIDKMVKRGRMDYVKDAEFLATSAGNAWEEYQNDPDDMTPEEWADEEMDCWSNDA